MKLNNILLLATGLTLVAVILLHSSCKDNGVHQSETAVPVVAPPSAAKKPAPAAPVPFVDKTIDGVELSVVPLFESASVYVKCGDKKFGSCKLFFRVKGAVSWLEGFPPEKDVKDNSFRGSIVKLSEDSEYEIAAELLDSNSQSAGTARQSFKTWTSSPPVKKVIVVGKDLKASGAIEISGESGSPDGWIKYVAEPGLEIDGGSLPEAAIGIKKSSYIILEGLKIKGGRRYGVLVSDSENVRIVNCEISGWGRAGKQIFSKEVSHFGAYYDERRQLINFDGGIFIADSTGTVVERCYVHDPRGTANPWFYAHPAGPEAMTVKAKGATVVRYNDFIGSDAHRWNDSIEGHGNGKADGGFNKDADIYGNMLAFGNDDGIELDGGQCNIRFFRNKVEGFLCGVSTAPNMVGPSYIFENLVVNLGDEDGVAGSVIKNGGGSTYSLGKSFFFNNTFHTDGNGIAGVGFGNDKNRAYYLGLGRNNIISCSGSPLHNFDVNPQNDYDFDLIPNKAFSVKSDKLERNGVDANPVFKNSHNGDYNLSPENLGMGKGVKVPNFFEPGQDGKVDIGAFQTSGRSMLPYRPMPVSCDKGQVNLHANMRTNKVSQETVTISVEKGSKWTSQFKIAKNQVFDWLKVEPESRALSEGAQVQFKVSLNADKLKKGGLYRGLFLVRMENGLSVPVTVYAKVFLDKFNLLAKLDKLSGAASFKTVEDAGAISGKAILFDGWDASATPSGKHLELPIDIPSDGTYYIFARAKASEPPVPAHDSLFLAIDDGQPIRVNLKGSLDWTWSPLSCPKPDEKDRNGTKLSAGKHVLKIYPREGIHFDALAVRSDSLMEE